MDTSTLTSLLSEITGHLGAARMQTIPTDDRIIAEHVVAAHELAKEAWRMLRHIHVASGTGSDICKSCGRDLRDEIHLRAQAA